MSTYSNKAVALFEYLPEDTVLTGLPAVTVGLSPDALSERAGIKWTGDDTELGPSVFSVFRLHPGGPRFFLSSWENAPYPAVTVSSDARAKESDIDMLLARLGVAEDEIIDRVPVRAAQPAARRARLLSKADIIEAVANNSGLSKADSSRGHSKRAMRSVSPGSASSRWSRERPVKASTLARVRRSGSKHRRLLSSRREHSLSRA